MDVVTLTATARSADQAAAQLRREDKVPCILYGNDIENALLQCEYNEIYKAYAAAGGSTLVELQTGSKTIPVLFHAIDFEPVSDRIIHVDFYAVDMKKEIEAEIPLVFEGEAPAVKDLGGILITPHDQVMVKCLPIALPHNLAVRIEPLAEFGSSLTVADIAVPQGVVILDDPEVVIATVQEPRTEEAAEEAPAAEEGSAAEAAGPEGEKKDEAQEGSATQKEES